jgi:hypothetical protein
MKYIRTENGVEKFTDEEYAVRFPKPEKTAIELRQAEYGSAIEQIEFITENGLTAWKAKVSEIKTRIPK